MITSIPLAPFVQPPILTPVPVSARVHSSSQTYPPPLTLYHTVDSLKAIEVRNWIYRELQCDVSVFDLLSSAPLSRLAVMIVGRSALVSKEVAAQAADAAAAALGDE